ncbi:hypothetical protein GCM10017687_30320 [Streptomyces echinatus]|uniref:hypothetical protein n=1 Tax=Streptomyces echinatus TaxID=67293 RepID=UPI0031E6E55C
MSPGSAQTFVWISRVTVSTAARVGLALEVDGGVQAGDLAVVQPVVDPIRNTVAPTVASAACLICTVWPLPT